MIVDSAVYEGGRRRDGDLAIHEAMEACHAPDCFTWIGLFEPTEDEFESIRSEFDLHPLAVEDAIHAHERPKLEVFGEMVFIVLKTARYVDPSEVIKLGEILVFLGHDYIITVRHGEASELGPVRRQLEDEPELLQHGPGAVLHAIVDRVVDDYGPAIAGLGEDIDQVEDEVFSEERVNVAERIYKLKREVLQFSHAVGPLVDPVDRLARGKYGVIHPQVRTYFRDVNDHLLRAHDLLEGFRDLLTSVLQANMAQVGVRQNEDMRKISAYVAMAVQARGLAVGSDAVTEDCIFCKIVAGDLPAHKVDEDEHTIAFMDLNPWTRGHALVVPRRHSRNLYEVPDEDLEHAAVAAKRLALTMRDRLECDGVNLLNCCEPAAWQTVFHTHIHVIPRYDDDPLQLPVRPRQAEQDELAAVASDLRGW